MLAYLGSASDRSVALAAAPDGARDAADAAAAWAHAVLAGRVADVRVWRFLDDYAAAVVLARSAPEADSFHVNVVGLDGWELAAGRGVAVASLEARVLFAGEIAVDEVALFGRWFDALKAAAVKRSGAARHATAKGGGHQHTPAFVLALARESAEKARAERLAEPPAPRDEPPEENELPGLEPLGGFTDVGRHAGGEARDCALPLTRALVRELLCAGRSRRSPRRTRRSS
jgi:hypothetical protein